MVITIIVLLILAGVALSILTGENSIFRTTDSAVEQNNKAQVKEKIELAIMEKQLEEKREVSLDEIIDKLIENGITTEEESDREIGTVITEEGYEVTIEEKEEGGWEVKVGEKGTAKIRLNISKTPEVLTSKVTIKIEGRLIGIGLKELVMPDGSKKEYEEGITKIEETYEVTSNGTYKFVLKGRDGQEIEKEIIINNIVEGLITILPSTTEWTKDNIIVEVIYPEGTEELIREISIDNGATWKEYKEGVEISENTIIQARIRNTEEIIRTATLTIDKIDKTAPIVTANVSSLTITKGDANETKQYFTIDQNGNAPIINEEYSPMNTNTLEAGTQTITCTATKANGLSTSAIVEVIVKRIVPVDPNTGLATENFIVTTNIENLQIVIPAGFAPAILNVDGSVRGVMPAEEWLNITEEQINKGIVIIDAVSNYNEFVWIPVEGNGIKFGEKTFSGTTYTEGAPSGYYDSDNISNVKASVDKYKGFYIGRYEAYSANYILYSKRGVTPSKGQTWTAYNSYSKNLYTIATKGVQSRLLYGAEYDTALAFMMKTKPDYATSTNYGNYSGSLRVTAGTSTDVVNNIYDMAGNVSEWRLERYSSEYAGSAGNYDGNVYSASFRSHASTGYSARSWRNENWIYNRIINLKVLTKYFYILLKLLNLIELYRFFILKLAFFR